VLSGLSFAQPLHWKINFSFMKMLLFNSCVMLLFSLFGGCKASSNDSNLSIPSHPLTGPADLNVLINQIGDARIVLLGEASHGTSEYYTWRAAISKRLIQEKGFDMIAIEGEWADSYRVNQFIKGAPADSIAAVNILSQYDRWPTWMWGNREVASLVTWLNQYNNRSQTSKVGFFGLDVYCLGSRWMN
jgi:erythromycin esterase